MFHADKSSSFTPELVSSTSGGRHPVAVRLSYGTGALGLESQMIFFSGPL